MARKLEDHSPSRRVEKHRRRAQNLPLADPVKVESGRSVTVFNACGNDYRLMVAIHYDKQRIYTLQFLTHAASDKNRWKKDL